MTQVPSQSQPEGKKKNKKKGKEIEEQKQTNREQTVTGTAEKKKPSETTAEKEKSKSKSSKVRNYGNGLVIEELSMGKPDGKKATPGRSVSLKFCFVRVIKIQISVSGSLFHIFNSVISSQVAVHYIGKLVRTGKIFDSNIGKAPFKFRLGTWIYSYGILYFSRYSLQYMF